MRTRIVLALLLLPIAALAQTRPPASDGSWQFVVAGDSRNCGAVVMPAIAEAAKNNNAMFYWPLGDWRSLYQFDADMVSSNVLAATRRTLLNFLHAAFQPAPDNHPNPSPRRHFARSSTSMTPRPRAGPSSSSTAMTPTCRCWTSRT